DTVFNDEYCAAHGLLDGPVRDEPAPYTGPEGIESWTRRVLDRAAAGPGAVAGPVADTGSGPRAVEARGAPRPPPRPPPRGAGSGSGAVLSPRRSGSSSSISSPSTSASKC